MAKRFPTLHDIENETKGPLYVTNTTKDQTRGTVLFTVANLDGRGSTAIIVPLTWMALDLTEQVNREAIIRSSDFRRAVTHKHITLVSKEEAEDINSRDGNEIERERIMRELSYDVVETRNGAMEENDDEDDADNETVGKITRKKAPVNEMSNLNVVGDSDVNPAVIMMFDDEKPQTQEQYINSLRLLQNLTAKDYKYVFFKAKELGMKKLKLFAKEQREALAEA